MTVQIKTFPSRDRGQVDIAFFEGSRTIGESDLIGEPEPIDAPADFDAIGTVLDRIVDGDESFDERHEIDATVAPVVHQNLDLTREQAARPGIWHWMATMWRPDFVRYRWPWGETSRTENSMREKFLGAGTDIYSNAFGRLWWMAELSVRPEASDPYRTTREALEVQTLANRLFDPAFARYRPAVVAFAEELVGEDTDVIIQSNKRFNQSLSAIQLESRDLQELEQIVGNVVNGVKEDYNV